MTPADDLLTGEGAPRIAWIAPDLARTRGWLGLGEPVAVICADAMGLADAMPFATLEIPPSDDSPSSAHSLLDRTEARSFLQDHAITHLLVFKGTRRLLDRAEALDLRVMIGAPSVAQRFENKVLFSDIARDLGLRTPATQTGQRGLPSHEELSAALGPLHVLQSARGHSGQGTWRIASAADHARASEAIAHRGWKATAWIEGTTWTLNACVDRHGNIAVGPTYRQLTGIPECTPHVLGACGNIWGEDSAPEALPALAKTLGTSLHDGGFVGSFGIDAIDSGDALHLIEVNPRLTSGLSMEAMLSSARGATSVAESHLRAHRGGAIEDGPLPGDIRGSQLVLYARTEEVTSLQSAPLSGRYRLEGGACRRIDDCTDPAQTSAGEAIIWARTPHRPIPAGAEFLRIQSTDSLARPDSNTLSDHGAQWVRTLEADCLFSD